MKKAYLLSLHFLYWIIEVGVNLLNSKPKLINIKLKLGILILLLKGNDTNAQLLGRRSTCYMIGPRYRENFNLVLKNRFDIKDIANNTFKLDLGYQKPLYEIGLSGDFHNISQSASVGSYIKIFTIDERWVFKHFIGVNYQFNFSHSLYNEFNISTGFNFFHQKKINFEIAYEYTQYNDDERTHCFMPVVGAHYYFRDRRARRFHRRNRNSDKNKE